MQQRIGIVFGVLVGACYMLHAVDMPLELRNAIYDLHASLLQRDIDAACQFSSAIAEYTNRIEHSVRLYREQCTMLHLACAFGSMRLAKQAIGVFGDTMQALDIHERTPQMYNGLITGKSLSQDNIATLQMQSAFLHTGYYPHALWLLKTVSLYDHLPLHV